MASVSFSVSASTLDRTCCTSDILRCTIASCSGTIACMRQQPGLGAEYHTMRGGLSGLPTHNVVDLFSLAQQRRSDAGQRSQARLVSLGEGHRGRRLAHI
jgi:hypothetical protein